MPSHKKKRGKKSPPRKPLDPNLPIFQLKVSLDDMDPEIWRRIETPDCSLADLHEIIQSCMGWDDEHLYAFEIGDEEYGDPRRTGHFDGEDSRSMWLSNVLEEGEYPFVYEYDFGDSWRHTIEIENTLPAEENTRYPRCTDGRRACPLEDCGGIYGYYDLLEAWENRKEAGSENEEDEDEEYDERLEWLADDFDPEAFSVDSVNKELLRLRRWIARHPAAGAPSAQFKLGDRIRAKPGVVHSQYPDIPLGGWVGEVTRIAWVTPISYKIRWADETLAAAHPVYAKRRRRDRESPRTHWLDEGELESASAEPPVEMEQPTNLIVKPLSDEDELDRIRAIFCLTSDDPLPAVNAETQQRYFDYLVAHLTFPFEAKYHQPLAEDSFARKDATVIALCPPPTTSDTDSLLCTVRGEVQTEQLGLDRMQLDDDAPNCRYLDDYRSWLWECGDLIEGEEEEDDEEPDYEDYDEGYDEEDGFWSEDDDKYDSADEDFVPDDRDFAPGLLADRDTYEDPQPIHRHHPPVGRNDPCPCGSGKKFKKCCLNKPNSGFTE